VSDLEWGIRDLIQDWEEALDFHTPSDDAARTLASCIDDLKEALGDMIVKNI